MSKKPFIPIDYFDEKGQFIQQTVPSHLQPFYFTFCKSSPNTKKYVLIHAESWDRARELMNTFYGIGNWAFQYDAESWINEEGHTRAELHELSKIEITPTTKTTTK